MGNAVARKGVDEWGKFYSMTGMESPETCFWCGKPCSKRYCSDACRDRYYASFYYPVAREMCIDRYRAPSGSLFCADCRVCGKRSDMEVHHVTPVNGAPYVWSVLNQQANLDLLCSSCHEERTRKRYGHGRYRRRRPGGEK